MTNAGAVDECAVPGDEGDRIGAVAPLFTNGLRHERGNRRSLRQLTVKSAPFLIDIKISP
jgi:hypothetical protein